MGHFEVATGGVFWVAIRVYEIFYDLDTHQALSLVMVRNFDTVQSAVGPIGKHMKTAGQEVFTCLDIVVKPRLVIALGAVRQYSDKIFSINSEKEIESGFLLTAKKRRKRAWKAYKGKWSTGIKWLYVSASGIHPSLFHVSKEDTFCFLRKVSKMARSLK